MDWAKKRKIVYSLWLAGFIVLLAAYPVYRQVSKPATCLDQKQNGTETGLDCGGECALMCTAEVKQPRVMWAKAFHITGEIYDLGVYVENVNANAGLKNARYTISVLGNSGELLAERKNMTEIAPSSRVLLFETGVNITGTPVNVEVSFVSDDLTKWTRAVNAPSAVVTKNKNLKDTDTKPRFDAVLVNNDYVSSVSNLTLSAVIYDGSRNPIAVSKTYVDRIIKGGEEKIFFTWPSPFLDTSENFITEIIVTPRAIFAN